MRTRARAIRQAGTVEDAIASSRLPLEVTLTVSEGVILGLLRQGVRKYVVMLGHGNTELGEALRIYTELSRLQWWVAQPFWRQRHSAGAVIL